MRYGDPAPKGDGLIARFRRWARFSPQAVMWLQANVGAYDGVIVDGLWNYAAHVARRVLPVAATPYVVFPHGMLDPWFRARYPLKHAGKSVLWQFNEGPLLRGADAGAFTCAREAELARGHMATMGAARVGDRFWNEPAARSHGGDGACIFREIAAIGRQALPFVSKPSSSQERVRNAVQGIW